MFNSLYVAQSGLNAARVSVNNISNNIANENTPGYKKRVVQLSEMAQIDSTTGRGVSTGSAYRVTSQTMYDKLMSENSKTNYYSKLTTMLTNVESVFAETDSSGFSNDLNNYFQAVENLRSNPNSLIYKNTVKSSGAILTDSLSNIYNTVQKQQADEKDELKTNVTKVNDIIKQIGDINEKIQKYDSTNTELLDKRDTLESELSNYADISSTTTNGVYELKLSGVTVISNDTNVRSVELMESSTYQADKFDYEYFNTATNSSTVVDSIKNNYNPSTGAVTSKGLDLNDKVTYKLNNQYEVSAKIGEKLDLDGNGTLETTVDSTNLIRALAFKINNTTGMNDFVTAYNGDASIGFSGTQDNYLRIQSKFPGETNSFVGQISIEKYDNTTSTTLQNREVVYKNDTSSSKAQSNVALGLYGTEISLKSGILKAQIENVSSDSSLNKYQSYLDKLDAFAKTLSDITSSYSTDSSGKYIYGEMASDGQSGTINSLGLFSGSSVKTLKFNSSSIDNLTQDNLDYLASIQWKSDLNFDGKAQGSTTNNSYSLANFYDGVKVSVSSDNESVIALKDVQSTVKQSIQSSYDKLTKVDKDEEMLNLMTFQAAYTANAKIVTAIDEMIQTLLGLKK